MKICKLPNFMHCICRQLYVRMVKFGMIVPLTAIRHVCHFTNCWTVKANASMIRVYQVVAPRLGATAIMCGVRIRNV